MWLHELDGLLDRVLGGATRSANLLGRSQRTIAGQVTSHEDGGRCERVGRT